MNNYLLKNRKAPQQRSLMAFILSFFITAPVFLDSILPSLQQYSVFYYGSIRFLCYSSIWVLYWHSILFLCWSVFGFFVTAVYELFIYTAFDFFVGQYLISLFQQNPVTLLWLWLLAFSASKKFSRKIKKSLYFNVLMCYYAITLKKTYLQKEK